VATDPLIRRARPQAFMTVGRLDRVLGHPVAFVLAVLVLLVAFSWTFVTNPGRPAPADDPAYYSWRTEALMANDPETLLTADGPLGMYAGGYRVATPVLAGLMRRVMDVGILTPTILISVGLRVLIALLLAGFAYRYRPDPLIWHGVFFGVASLMLAPPFAGYIDNVMTLLFLSASLYLIEPARTSWGPRIAFFLLLLVSGFTHPTTLAIFCLTLGAMAFVRFVMNGFSLRRALADDGAMLVAGFAAALATYAIWKVGIWGESASLGEAALPPPAGADFFARRLNDWLRALRPVVNGPLFAIGVIGLLAAGRRAARDELTRVAIVWLAPLIGIFGVLAGVAYPYYRFFNTTTAWLLLVGIGAFFVVRYCLDVAGRGGLGAVALLGVLAVAFVLGTNLRTGMDVTGWNDPDDGWLKPAEQEDLGTVRAALEDAGATSVVFVVDDDAEEDVRIYGFAKRAGNVSRFGVPADVQDRTAFYLGSLDRYLAGEPTDRGDYYRELSSASLQDANRVAGTEPDVVVVPSVFNEAGSNAGVEQPSTEGRVWYVTDCEANGLRGCSATLGDPGRGFPFGPILGGLLLLIPGALLLPWALPGARFVDALGLVPALAAASLCIVGMFVLAGTGGPLTSGRAWTILVVTGAVGLVAFAASFFARDPGLGRGSPNFPATP